MDFSNRLYCAPKKQSSLIKGILYTCNIRVNIESTVVDYTELGVDSSVGFMVLPAITHGSRMQNCMNSLILKRF